MKRYISAILIPCFLLQLFGCYSMREMTLDELKNFTDPDDIVIKTNQKEVLINRRSTEIGSMSWKANDSSIIIKKIEPINLENYNKLSNQDFSKSTNQEMEIKYNQIESIEIDDFNLTTTALLLTGIAAIITFGALGSTAGAVSGF